MRSLLLPLLAIGCLACLPVSVNAGIMSATYILGTPSVTGDELSIPISLEFSVNADEEVVYFSIGVDGSDPLLTDSQTNYLRFSFDLESPAMDDFSLVFNFGSTEFDNFVDYDTVTGGLTPGTQLLGELKVDFAGSGLTPDASKVSIVSTDTLIGYEVPGQSTTFDFNDVTYRQDGGGTNPIPEPASMMIPLIGLLSGVCARRRRRLLDA